MNLGNQAPSALTHPYDKKALDNHLHLKWPRSKADGAEWDAPLGEVIFFILPQISVLLSDRRRLNEFLYLQLILHIFHEALPNVTNLRVDCLLFRKRFIF